MIKKLKTIQLISLILTAIFVAITLFFCVVHLIWISRGVENNNAIYNENGTATYLAGGQVVSVKVPKALYSKTKNGTYITIYYSENNPSRVYLPKQIARVFVFAGVGVVFIGVTVFLTIKIDKEQNKLPDELENEEQQ